MQRKDVTADLIVPTFTKNVKVGQPPQLNVLNRMKTADGLKLMTPQAARGCQPPDFN
jgi:hypothetical protein